MATVLYFQHPSEGENAFFLGYSLGRLLFGGVYILLLLVPAVLGVSLIVKPDWQKAMLGWMHTRLSNKNILLMVTFTLFFAMLITIWMASIPGTFRLVDGLRIALERLQAGFLWGWLVCFQALGLLVFTYHPTYKSAEFWQGRKIWELLVIFFMAGLSLYQWSVIFFQIPVFTRLYRWFWYFHEKPVQWWAVAMLAGLFGICLYWLLQYRVKTWQSLALLIFLGYTIQVGFGFIEGGGWIALRQKALQSGHVVYLQAAAEKPSLHNIFHHYYEITEGDPYLQTKPPGLLLFYRSVQAVSEVFRPAASTEDRMNILSWVAAYFFPLIASLSSMVLFLFSRLFMEKQEAVTATLFLVLIPNFVLMPLEIDQFLFPVLFLMPLLLEGLAIRSPKPMIYAFAAGITIYLCLFVSFSLLAVIPLSLAWVGFSLWDQYRSKERWKHHILILAGMAVGLIFSGFLVWLMTGYDPLQRYMSAMELHRSFKNFKEGWDQLQAAIRLNNFEYAHWISFSIAALSVSSILRSIVAFISRKAQYLDFYILAFFLTYLALNLMGQTRGEVGRLWLFLNPSIALLAAHEVRFLFRKSKTGLCVGYLLPFVTTVLIFHFQDYW